MRELCFILYVFVSLAACSSDDSLDEPGPAAASPLPASVPEVTAVPPPSVPGETRAQTTTAPIRPSPAPLADMRVRRVFPKLSFARMVHLTHAGDSTDRLFLVLQPGRIMVFENDQGTDSPATFLDIRPQVNDRGNEEGLLGLAFDPEYTQNGYFYVYYSAGGPRRSILSRFSVKPNDPNAADPNSEKIIMVVRQPFSNHNGGHVVFGPDGYLYVGLGDGGSAGDPRRNGQNLGTLLGSIIRIDVSALDAEGTYRVPPDNPFVGSEGAREEIWAYGLRNPWRFNFDPETGDLWAADVGQNLFEEIDIIKPGRNYGWNVMEGFDCFQRRECDQSGLELPVIDYGRRDGCSVTGGYVYRGARLPSLYGAYVYGDFCSGKIWALRHDGDRVTEHLLLVDSDLMIAAFGEDAGRELYVLSFDRKIYILETR